MGSLTSHPAIPAAGADCLCAGLCATGKHNNAINNNDSRNNDT